MYTTNKQKVIRKPNKKVALLLAVYNGMLWLEQQIESLNIQRDVDITIYISIDPSTDSSKEFCNLLTQEKSNVHLLPDVGVFGKAAPNFFRLIRDVDFSSFDFIALSDQDDIWYPCKLSKSIDSLEEFECDGYSSNVTAFWENESEKEIDKAQPQVEWDYLFESAGPGCTYVMTVKLALELQKFVRNNQKPISSVWAHDWFIYAFSRAHGYKWYIDKLPSMLYRQHNSNQVGVNTGYKAILQRARFVLSNKALSQSSLIASLCGLDGHTFTKKWSSHSKSGLIYLALNSAKCRRKRLDQVFFFFSCILLLFKRKKV